MRNIFLTLLALFFILPSGGQEALTVQDCIDIALKDNPSIRSSLINLEKTREKLNTAKAQYFPSLSMSASARKSSSFSGDDDGLFNSYSAGLSARYSIYQGGKIKDQVKVAYLNITASELSYDSALQDMVYRIKQAYYSLLQARHNLKTARKNVERSETYLELAKTRLEAGVAILSDVLKVQVELSDARLNLINAENSHRNAGASLCTLLGLSPSHNVDIADDLDDVDYIRLPEYRELLGTALEIRPEIKRIEKQMEIQNTAIKMSRADYLPGVSLDAGYSYGGSRISDMDDSWNFGVSMSLSLFSGGATKSAILQEKLALKDLEYQKEELIQQVDLALFQAYNDFAKQEEVIENSRIYLENAGLSLEIAQEGYREGTHSIIELVDAQASLVSAESRYIKSLADYRISLASLEKALGQELER
jgi:outer membrane protein TolC